MKKNLFLMGMAAMTLASCTNEVLKVADMHTIGFDAFVGNTTRAVTEVKTLNNFYVFGNTVQTMRLLTVKFSTMNLIPAPITGIREITTASVLMQTAKLDKS